MVDVSEKNATRRVAVASGVVRMQSATLQRIRAGKIAKGDVLAVADVAAVMAFFSIYWLIWLWVSAPSAQSAIFYIAFGIAAAQIVWHYTLIRRRTREGCFIAFSKSHWISFAVFCGIAAGLAAR